MRNPVRSAMLPILFAVLAVAAMPAAVKDPVGVYALIDRVVFEPDEANPERVQLWGLFRVADTFGIEDGALSRIDLSGFHPVTRGYMYFTVNATGPATSRSEWKQMAEHAGTGQPIAFGARIPTEASGSHPGSHESADAMRDTAYIGWLMRYNGHVRSADEKPASPDPFPLRMKPNPPSLLVGMLLPAVQPLLREASAEGGRGAATR